MLRFQTDPLSAGAGMGGLMGAGVAPPGNPASLTVPGAGPDPGADPGADAAPASIEDAAKQALTLINQALASPDIDPEDANFAEAATTALTKILATNQKNQDAAMGTTPAHKHMRKATKSSGGGGGY